ncbi:MAG TPA: CcoQ/FixQ family Cbb3-type cytochrome c oxidase assembly chaperone [Edaphocola sp.]|nr:CcoQ/FixQ family Cbb3-type cytochrome c oxidase assembly chaperone [Edaphocola sp.]
MKFANYLTKIENVAIYPIISLVIFTAVFLIVLLYVFTSSRKQMDKNSNIPLD